MMLLTQTESYRVATESDAVETIENFKAQQNEGGYTLMKNGYVYKNKKAKGEVVDEWYVVTVVKDFTI